MAAPHEDRSEPIASTYQFRAFTDRTDTDEIPVARRPRGGIVLVAAVLVVAIVLTLMAVLLTL